MNSEGGCDFRNGCRSQADDVRIRLNKKFLNYRKLGDVSGTIGSARKPARLNERWDEETKERAGKMAGLMKRNEGIAI